MFLLLRPPPCPCLLFIFLWLPNMLLSGELSLFLISPSVHRGSISPWPLLSFMLQFIKCNKFPTCRGQYFNKSASPLKDFFFLEVVLQNCKTFCYLKMSSTRKGRGCHKGPHCPQWPRQPLLPQAGFFISLLPLLFI